MEKWCGKLAVVTGAGSGMGAAIAEALSREGVNVVGLDIQKKPVEETAKKASKGKIHAHACDVSKPEAVEKTFDWIEETFGGVDILINCAGIVRCAKLFDLTKPSEYYLAVNDVNFCGYLLMARRAYKTMQDKPFGYIVNINSVAGHQQITAPLAELGVNIYGTTKHAVTQLTQLMKLEFSQGKKNIRVTSVSPGAVNTNIFEAGNLKVPGFDSFCDTGAHLQPSDIADQVIYLLSTKPNVNISELTVEPLGTLL